MDTNTHLENRNVHDFYIAKINNAVAEGRESLIGSLVSEYESLGREPAESIKAARPIKRAESIDRAA